jgi:hypothetical protein
VIDERALPMAREVTMEEGIQVYCDEDDDWHVAIGDPLDGEYVGCWRADEAITAVLELVMERARRR